MEAISKTSKTSKIVKLILITIIGSNLLTISAKIKIPFYPVPMTMQTFMVLFLGMALGPKLGLSTVTVYLLEGIFGFPVFANSPEKGIGLAYFTGPTMGYLVGFLVAVYFAGIRRDWFSWSNYQYLNTLTVFVRLIFSVSFIYILGLLWLGTLIGWDKPIYKLGAEPFLLAELFKITLLTFLYPWIKKFNQFI